MYQIKRDNQGAWKEQFLGAMQAATTVLRGDSYCN